MNRLIFSRKGVDSSYGKFASPILPDGTLVYVPIPSQREKISYSQMRVPNSSENYFDFLKILNPKNSIFKWPDYKCHLDPDVDYNVLDNRSKNWRPCFGQVGARVMHLETHNVKKGDLFLFFGWFKHTKLNKEKVLAYERNSKYPSGVHCLFGWLEIGDILKCTRGAYGKHEWLQYHSHGDPRHWWHETNTIYIASKKLSLNPKLPGGGVFKKATPQTILTKPYENRSVWSLPKEAFKNTTFTYHTQESWTGPATFKSACRGQEFIVYVNEKVNNWTKALFKNLK